MKGRWRRAALLGMVRLFAALPMAASQRLGGLIGWMAWRTGRRVTRTSRQNIARCLPELTPKAREALVRESLIQTGKTLTETGPLWRWPMDRLQPLIREVVGREHLDQAMARGRGAILLGPHIGAWELGGLYSALLYPTTILYRPPRQPELEEAVRKARARFGANLVPAGHRGVRALLAALKRGELVAILPDQEPRFGQGVFAPFFGQPAYTLSLVASLLRRTGAVAVMGYVERLPAGAGYRLHYLPAPEALDDPDPVTAATALNRGVEQCVRALPEQYQWSYRRFRRAEREGLLCGPENMNQETAAPVRH
ncbi:MAG: lysophospholipid acyltransferase family protein [Halothiobacillaceae bacterium]